MVGTIIVFEDVIQEFEREIDITPTDGGYRIDIFDENGKSLLKEVITISKANLIELKQELIQIL